MLIRLVSNPLTILSMIEGRSTSDHIDDSSLRSSNDRCECWMTAAITTSSTAVASLIPRPTMT